LLVSNHAGDVRGASLGKRTRARASRAFARTCLGGMLARRFG
jgi:hypothetical protein